MLKRWLGPVVLATALLPLASWADAGCSDPAADTQGSSGCSDGSANHGSALFSYRGETFSEPDLDLTTRQAIYELAEKFYNDRQLLLDNALWQLYLAQQAKSQQKSEDDVARELLRPQMPTEEQMKAFYEANKAQIPAPYEQVQGQLAQYLVQQQMLASQRKIIDGLKQNDDFKLLAQPPQPPVAIIDTEGYPSKGDKLAPVEIVEFADYQCPHCKTASGVMAKLEERYGDKLRVIYMDFPINPSGISQRVAEGAVCADQQGKFWPYHSGAFAEQSSLSTQSPASLAKAQGLDMPRFNECLEGDAAKQKVARAKAEARRLGLDSTPTFFINGVKLHADSGLESALTREIDKALKAADS